MAVSSPIGMFEMHSKNQSLGCGFRALVRTTVLSAVLPLLLACPGTSEVCPDPNLRSVSIGGDQINGNIELLKGEIGIRKIDLYRGGKLVWWGMSDSKGQFEIDH